jgi:phosphate/sulfate permease
VEDAPITLAWSPEVGATRRLSAVRWGVAGNIVVAWIVTLPAAGAVAAVA